MPAVLTFCVLSSGRLAAQEPEQEQAPETAAPAPDAQDAAPQPDQPDQPNQQDQANPAIGNASPDAQPGTPAQPAPDLPKWPVNEKPGQPTVTWDSHGLSIAAANSSLQQIMKDISAATGMKVEGMSSDERVFGVYGPGQARDVLSQLLQGAGYNVIMIGDQGQGTPRQLLLSARHAGDGQGQQNRNSANGGDDDNSADDSAADDQPVQPPPMRPGFPGRTPQQRMEEQRQLMQQRQQMLQQQQQQPQPPNPQ